MGSRDPRFGATRIERLAVSCRVQTNRRTPSPPRQASTATPSPIAQPFILTTPLSVAVRFDRITLSVSASYVSNSKDRDRRHATALSRQAR